MLPRRQVILCALAVSLALGSIKPVLAAPAGRESAIKAVAALPETFTVQDRQRLLTVLQLPRDLRYSLTFIEQALPDWQKLDSKLSLAMLSEKDPNGPCHQAALRFAALYRQILPRAAAAPAMKGFDLNRYRRSVAMFAGQERLPWPGQPKREARFTNRLMGHPENQLDQVCDYLLAYYKALGIASEAQSFQFEGRTYRNVIATIPGRSAETVALVDHFDVAETYDYAPEALKEAADYGLSSDTVARIQALHQSGAPVPGADDNASATAALLEAAHVFKGQKPAKTIKLVHLNGEEFPGDCYGARQYVARVLKRNEKLTAVVVLDMIGVDRTKSRQFQISLGRHPRSFSLADYALRAAATAAKGYKPLLRGFDDAKSYLYNTDGQIFSGAGIPVILLNERVNYDEELMRLGYHDEFDRVELIDWPYAKAIASVGLSTVLMAAGEPSWAAEVMAARKEAASGPSRASHFAVELLNSPLYAACDAEEQRLGRPLTDAELLALVDADANTPRDINAEDTSIVKRIAKWFPEFGGLVIGPKDVFGELRYLRAMKKALR